MTDQISDEAVEAFCVAYRAVVNPPYGPAVVVGLYAALPHLTAAKDAEIKRLAGALDASVQALPDSDLALAYFTSLQDIEAHLAHIAEQDVEVSRWRSDAELLRKAIEGLLEHYTALVNSGDCGFWDPEKELVVMEARAALNGGGE